MDTDIEPHVGRGMPKGERLAVPLEVFLGER